MALTRRALGGITIGGSAALALSACGGNTGSNSNGELVWAIAYPWEAWNLNTTTGNNIAGKMALQPMIPVGQVGYDFDPESKVFYDDAIFAGAPELVSEEPMTLKFTLNDKAQWSDGEPVRLEDFIFQWYSMSGKEEHAVQENAIPSETAWGENIEKIEQAEDGTITVTFVEGYTDPEWAFNGGVFLPSHYAEANGFETWQEDPAVMGEACKWFNENLWGVSTGPYKPVLKDGKPDAKLGEYVKYEINDKYQGSVKPTIKQFTTKTVTGIEEEVTELRQGTIAGCWPNDFSLEELEKLEENPNLKYEVYAGSTWSHFDINVRNPLLKDLALRQAVFTAVNIADIKEKAFPGTEVPVKGNHFFSEGSPYYVDYVTDTKQGSGDLDAAKAILTEAGYTGVGEKLMTPGGEEVKFNFRFATSNEIRKLTGEIIQAQIAELGIEIELKGFTDDEFSATLESNDFDMIVYSWVGDAAFSIGPSQYFQTDGGSNYGGYSLPEIDELIPQVRATFDLDQAAEATNQIGKLATENAFTLPLYDSPLSVMWDTTLVEGPGVNPVSQSGPMYNVREWKQP